MKKLLLILTVLAFGTTLLANITRNDDRRNGQRGNRLVRMGYQVADMLQDSARHLNRQERREVRQNLRNIKSILNGGGSNEPVYPSQMYCVSACKAHNGKVDSKTLEAGIADFELEAYTESQRNLKKKHNCSYGTKKLGCDELDEYDSHEAAYTCSTYNSNLDTKNIKYAKGRSALEARVKATKKVKAAHNCSYGIIKMELGPYYNSQNYCRAACKTYDGKLNGRTIEAAYGDSLLEAKVNAIDAVKKSHSCSYGIKIEVCQAR